MHKFFDASHAVDKTVFDKALGFHIHSREMHKYVDVYMLEMFLKYFMLYIIDIQIFMRLMYIDLKIDQQTRQLFELFSVC